MKVLARRGVDFEELIREYRHPQHGLPKMLAYIHRPGQESPERRYLYTDADLAKLREREAGVHGGDPIEHLEIECLERCLHGDAP